MSVAFIIIIVIIIIFFSFCFIDLEFDLWCQGNGPVPFCTPYITFIY